MGTLDVLKALADETRLRIINLLFMVDEMCACEIEAVLALNQSNASRHLTRLRTSGLIRGERRGQWVHFALLDAFRAPDGILEPVLNAARADEPALRDDLDRLDEYRRNDCQCATIRERIESVSAQRNGGSL